MKQKQFIHILHKIIITAPFCIIPFFSTYSAALDGMEFSGQSQWTIDACLAANGGDWNAAQTAWETEHNNVLGENNRSTSSNDQNAPVVVETFTAADGNTYTIQFDTKLTDHERMAIINAFIHIFNTDPNRANPLVNAYREALTYTTFTTGPGSLYHPDSNTVEVNASPDNQYFFSQLAHETFHSFFGHHITNNTSQLCAINEGLAIAASAIMQDLTTSGRVNPENVQLAERIFGTMVYYQSHGRNLPLGIPHMEDIREDPVFSTVVSYIQNADPNNVIDLTREGEALSLTLDWHLAWQHIDNTNQLDYVTHQLPQAQQTMQMIRNKLASDPELNSQVVTLVAPYFVASQLPVFNLSEQVNFPTEKISDLLGVSVYQP